MTEYRVITVLVPRVIVGTILVLAAGTLITNNNASGGYNKPFYLAIVVVGLVVTATFLRGRQSTRVDTAIAIGAAFGLAWGIWTIERPQLLHVGYWEGFGDHVAIATLALVVLFVLLVRPQHFTRPVRIALVVIVGSCCLFDLLGAIRTSDYMPFVNNNINEINDMLGPVAGRVPDSTYIPQYTALYGWLFLPLKFRISPPALVDIMSIVLTVLGFVTVFLAVWIVRRVLWTGGYLLAAALVVPITYVTSHQIGDLSSIASLFQGLPIRLFAGFIILAAGLTDLVLTHRGTARTGRLVSMGVLCGLVAWTSQDFGLAACGVYGLIILGGAATSVRIRAFGAWLGGVIIAVAAYPLFLLAIGSPLNLSFVAAYVKLFGSGLGTAPIQVPGPVLVVLPIIIASTAAGWVLMLSHRRPQTDGGGVRDDATLALAFVGTWSAICILYYINRAYAAGQLQTMLLPTAVCVASLVSIVIHSDETRDLWESTPQSRLSRGAPLFPVGMMACLCFAAVLLTADPVTAARDLVNPPPEYAFANYDLPSVLAAVDAAKAYTAGRSGKLTYLGESFNYVSLATGVPSSAILYPYPLPALGAVTQIECRYLENHHSEWMVLSVNAVRAYGRGVCGMYRTINLAGITDGQLQETK